jgi:hypothetical protein
MSDEVHVGAAVAACDLIGRTGARYLQIGYLNQAAVNPEDADWWASAQYHGARVTVEHRTGPVAALEALALRLMTGAKCVHCGGLIALDPEGAAFYENAPMSDGTRYSLEEARSRPQCLWTRADGHRWTPGCAVTS